MFVYLVMISFGFSDGVPDSPTARYVVRAWTRSGAYGKGHKALKALYRNVVIYNTFCSRLPSVWRIQ